jgi:hypothetical protein
MNSTQDMMIDTISKIFAGFGLAEMIVSIILNLLVIIIILKSKKLRSTSTFKILAFSAVNDMILCIPWNLEIFLYTMFNNKITNNVFYCKWISNFLEFTSLSIESWLLLSISFDRLLSLHVNKWTKFY